MDELSLRNTLIEVEEKFNRQQLVVDELKTRLIDLRYAVQERHKDRLFDCGVCLKTIPENMLLQHICSKEFAFIPCTYCNEPFWSTKKLLDHLEIAHKDATYFNGCQLCPKTFNMALLHDLHKKIVHGKPPITIKVEQTKPQCDIESSRKAVTLSRKGK